jgi:hypothetical protein
MSRPVSIEVLVAVLQDALTHAADLQHPRLQPFVADIQGVLARLTASLGPGKLDDPQLQALQTQAKAADVAHDDAYRALHGLLTALTLRGPEPQRTLVRRGLTVLFPEGLTFVAQSYAAEVGATEGFEQRLTHPDVQALVLAVTPEIPQVQVWLHEAVLAGQALGHALQAVDAYVAGQKAAGPSAAKDQFTARNEARKLWSEYLTAVDRAYPSSDPARGRLRQAWEHFVGA